VSTDPAAAAAVAQDPAASGTSVVPATVVPDATAGQPAASGTSVASATVVPDAGREVVVRVVSGSPTPAELAAVVAVLLAVSDAAPGPSTAPTSTWAAPAARLRTAYGHGHDGWRASALPR